MIGGAAGADCGRMGMGMLRRRAKRNLDREATANWHMVPVGHLYVAKVKVVLDTRTRLIVACSARMALGPAPTRCPCTLIAYGANVCAQALMFVPMV